MNLAISFSGGQTSAYMTDLLLNDPDFLAGFVSVKILFCNTGQECEKTLEFVDRCDARWRRIGHRVVWLESVVHPEPRRGTTHVVTSFDHAHRGMGLFMAMASKYGVPNLRQPHCTRELKLRPFYSYLRAIGWKKSETRVAVGIRSDEIDRMTRDPMLIYPLVKRGVNKAEVLTELPVRFGFSLGIPEEIGNCVWCWKKSDAKLAKAWRMIPGLFDGPSMMENGFGHGQVIFRRHRSAQDMEAMARARQLKDDTPGACSESCEVFASKKSPAKPQGLAGYADR